MILVLGGTTEGRKAAEVLDEAGTPYYYSTKTGEQQLPLRHGLRIDGALDDEAMTRFCHEKNIRLLVDAAHPFAMQLHRTVADVAGRLGLPVVRYERIYPPQDPSLTWIDDYAELASLLPSGSTLLATTGVQSIARLKPLEQQGVKVVYRILPRESSVAQARRQGATDSQLCYYEDGSTVNVAADAMLLKESGESGGFTAKVQAAKDKGMRIFVLKRPQLPSITYYPSSTVCHPHLVNGPYGLRRMVEQLLPDFYPLHSGLTTGTCATAATVAAAIRLLSASTPTSVPVVLPNGETIHVTVGYATDYAYCVKQAGDDPDVTNGLEIRAAVSLLPIGTDRESTDVIMKGGRGVGRFTLPGFDYPPGEPAINRAPRQMIGDNLKRLMQDSAADLPPGCQWTVTISVPDGEEIARRTFNPRLGIEGGISIIGVSGIVKPFSEEAFIRSIRKCMEVAKASGTPRVVINSGGKSERYVKTRYPDLPMQAFVEYGNYIGETLRIAADLQFPAVTLGVMLGKAVKLAQGHLDTHSRRATMDKDFVAALLSEAGCTIPLSDLTLARELWQRLPVDRLDTFARVVIGHCARHCRPLLPNGELTILLIDDDGKIYTE